MTISSDAISAVPICGSRADRIGIAFLAEWADAEERLVAALEQTYGLPLGIEHGQRYGNERVERQNEQSYGCVRIVVGHEQLWTSNATIKVALVALYGTKNPAAWRAFSYGDGPIHGQSEQPIRFTLDAALAQKWSLMTVVRGQYAQPWTSTTTVSGQGLFRYDLLERDPVAASLRHIWDLSGDGTIRLYGSSVRAFHLGQVI
ncbi:MAG: hypothetical protein HQL98_16170 [Magnetococcales bacterium]|nr:hypothetical protein [Magnetococcales bacterium]